jgi:uncharacterized Rossmann fold enzyme
LTKERILTMPGLATKGMSVFSREKIIIVGPACSPAETDYFARANHPIIAADSAVSVFGDSCVTPTAIVTDLDGDLQWIAKFASRGSVVVVHAHGDNIGLLGEAKNFGDCVLGTCQCKPFGKLFNFGGFTDGDRSAFLAERFGASAIELVGFDFDKPEPKAGADPAVKLRKLAWAKRLLGFVNIPVTVGGLKIV